MPQISKSSVAPRKSSFDKPPNNVSIVIPPKGKSDYFFNFMEESNQSNNGSYLTPDHFTIKTFNKLIDNSQVIEHESQGSLSSMPQS